MNHKIGIVCLLLLPFGFVRLAAQDSAPPVLTEQAQQSAPIAASDSVQNQTQEPPEPILKPNALETLRNFEPPKDEPYCLGAGDEITIDFAGRPELQAKLVVGPDGRITLPLAGDLMMAGQTRPEAAKTIESALAEYYANLAAMVTVTKYTANRVLLLGAVDHPGMLTFDGTPTLLEALTRGGLVPGPNKVGQLPERCAIYRGREQVIWVELKAMLESGNTAADLRLRRDDVIFVPSSTDRFISVLGEVNHPGAVQLTNTSTLASVLAEAGGFSGKAGSKPHIQIVDPAAGTSRVLSFNDLLNPAKSLEFTLRPGEIVFVPQSGFYHATYFLERLSPLLSVATMAFYAGVI